MISLRGASVRLLASPALTSVIPSSIASPQVGQIIELEGSGLSTVESIQLETASGQTWQDIPFFSRSERKASFKWPIDS
jgi:hypothetical protein